MTNNTTFFNFEYIHHVVTKGKLPHIIVIRLKRFHHVEHIIIIHIIHAILNPHCILYVVILAHDNFFVLHMIDGNTWDDSTSTERGTVSTTSSTTCKTLRFS